jgi:hypothetical protein
MIGKSLTEKDLNLVSVYAGVISQPGKPGWQPGKVLQQSRAFRAAGGGIRYHHRSFFSQRQATKLSTSTSFAVGQYWHGSTARYTTFYIKFVVMELSKLNSPQVSTVVFEQLVWGLNFWELCGKYVVTMLRFKQNLGQI